MRLISLDFDGPMHPTSAIEGIEIALGGIELDAQVVERNLFRWRGILVDLLVDHPDVVLSVHSNWRKYTNNTQLRNFLGEELESRLIGITAVDLPRQRSIEALADRAGVEHLLVIDDDRNAFDDSFQPLLLVDPETSISAADVQEKISAWLRETDIEVVHQHVRETAV